MQMVSNGNSRVESVDRFKTNESSIELSAEAKGCAGGEAKGFSAQKCAGIRAVDRETRGRREF